MGTNQAQAAAAAPGAGSPVLSIETPVNSANEFVRQVFERNGASCLVYYRNTFYQWIGSHYEEYDGDHLRSNLYEFLDNALTLRNNQYEPFNPTAHKVNQILDALKSVVEENSKRNAPFRLDHGALSDSATANLIACRNGVLDIETRKLVPHSPNFFNVNCLPFDYDPQAPTPKSWLRFLRQLWPSDKLARCALQEIFGLMLTADTRHQKIFMIVGPKRSGKGTIGRVLGAMLGKENVANPTLSGLSSHFGLSPLIDKRAAIISDARLGPQTNAHTVAERLLSISGEDALTIDRKYREPWTGRLGVRFLILTNELPQIADNSCALAFRFILLMLAESFYGREDLTLTDKLLRELPGILNWSLLGLDRLRRRGHFEPPQSSLDAIRQLEELASPVSAFLGDWCTIGPNERENVRTLYLAWRRWCEAHAHKPGPDHVFGRNLHAALPQMRARGRAPDRFYEGVGLSAEGFEQYKTAWTSATGRRS